MSGIDGGDIPLCSQELELPVLLSSTFQMPGGGSSWVAEPLNDKGWQIMKRSLNNLGYFRGLMEGSQGYNALLAAALERYEKTTTFARVR